MSTTTPDQTIRYGSRVAIRRRGAPGRLGTVIQMGPAHVMVRWDPERRPLVGLVSDETVVAKKLLRLVP